MVPFRSRMALPTSPRLMRHLLLILSLYCGAFGARAADTNAVLEGWFTAQKGVHTWSADFIQTRHLKALTQPLVTPGRLRFAAPGDFRWELGTPAQTIALRHEGEMYLIYPRLKRAEHYALDATAPREWRESMALLSAGFPRDQREFVSQFHLLALTETNGAWRLKLQPRSDFARQWMPELGITLATNDFVLLGTELVFVDGSSMSSVFTNAVMNPALDQKVFQWQAPADFKVTNPLAK